MEDLKNHIGKRQNPIRPRDEKLNIQFAKGKLRIYPNGPPRLYVARRLIWKKIQFPSSLISMPFTLLHSWHKAIIGLTTFIFLLWILTGIVWLGLADFRRPPAQIHINGHSALTTEDIYRIAGIDSNLKFYQIDANEVVDRLNQHPFIEEAYVRKLIPNSLFFVLSERRPYVFLKIEDSYYLIDEQLHPIQKNSTSQPKPSFVITGIKREAINLGQPIVSVGLQQGRELFNLLRASPLPLDQFAELDVADPLNLKLKLRNPPLIIQLGHDDYLEKIKTFESVYPHLRQSKKSLRSIDLRYQNRAIVRF